MRRSAIPPEFLPGRSRQLRRIEWLRLHGLCGVCAKPRLPQSRSYCAACLDRRTAQSRNRLGFKAWQPGHRGRPPFPRTAVVVVVEQELVHA